MEPVSFASEKKRASLGLLTTIADLETETAIAAALSQLLVTEISVTILETNRYPDAQRISFEINSPNAPGAVQVVRGLSDAELGGLLSDALGRLINTDLAVTVRRRSYGHSFRPARALLEPIRVSAFIEIASLGGRLDARTKMS
jgi:hypothetical protein